MQQLAQLPDVVQKFAAKRHPNKIVKIDTTPYWSKVRFQFTTAGVLAISQRQAFSYGVGGDRTPAGFTAATGAANAATAADTNLLEAGKTRLNADIFVRGISIAVMPLSDGALLRRIIDECAVSYSTDGQNTTPLAPLEKIPAGGGMIGRQPSALKAPPFDVAGYVNGGESASVDFGANGNPLAGNFLEFNDPIFWSGLQGSDSNFRVNFDIGRAITEAPGTARVAAAGVQAFTPPATLGDVGTYVDLRVALEVWAISLPSVNG